MNHLKLLMILFIPAIVIGVDSAPVIKPSNIKQVANQKNASYSMVAQIDDRVGGISSSSHFSLASFADIIEPDIVLCRENIGSTNLGKKGEGDNLPEEFLLDNNYPNPFNSSTIINYALPEASHVTIEVYNVLGQRVKTLVNEYKNAGYHSVRFNSTSIATGMYFYRIQANEFAKIRKMLIVK